MRAQHIGLVTTYSANNRVTDSAASGTALACGVKTNNGRVGVDPEGNILINITERAREKGMATGIVVTKDITDATPAAFSVHVKSRKLPAQIAMEQMRSGIEILVGGGLNNFEKREDKANLSDSLRARGYKVVYSLDELLAVDQEKVAGLLAPVHMKKAHEGRGDFLSQATEHVLELLKKSSNEGFFAMIEGSQIDGAGHANDAKGVLAEVLDFNKAIEAAYAFADRNPGTLVIVTADHETGGLTLPSGNEDFLLSDQGLKIIFSTGGHTAAMVPIYAYGAGSDVFSTIMDNTDVPKKLAALLGVKW
jgi:alkaline phosphatase